MDDIDEYTRLGGTQPELTYLTISPPCEEAEDIVRKVLEGVPRIHVRAELRADAERAVDEADLLGLLAIGCPDDEYDPEIDHVAALAAIGCLTADSVWAVFAHWFGEGMVDRDDPRLAALAYIQG